MILFIFVQIVSLYTNASNVSMFKALVMMSGFRICMNFIIKMASKYNYTES